MGFNTQHHHPVWLNYHHLYYFRTIAKEGSIARASVRLRLGQSTLSSQLKLLEDSLGQSLFERKNRKLILTEAGKTALAYANEVFRLGDEMVETLRDHLGTQVMEIQVGLQGGVPEDLLLSLMRHACQIKECKLIFHTGKDDELVRELVTHKIDLVLTNDLTRFSAERNVQIRAIQVSDLEVWAHPRYESLSKGFPSSLQGRSFVLPPVSCKLREDVDQFFKLNGLQVGVFAETQSVRLQRLIATQGMALMIASHVSQLEWVRDQKLISLGKLDQLQEEIWVVSAHRKTKDPLLTRIVQALCRGSAARQGKNLV